MMNFTHAALAAVLLCLAQLSSSAHAHCLDDFLVANPAATRLACCDKHSSKTIPTTVAALSTLTSIDLADCSLTGAVPKVWSGLTSLTSLSLSGGKRMLEVPDDLDFSDLSALKHVYLDRVHTKGSLPRFLIASNVAVRLEGLGVSRAKLTSIDELQLFTNLRTLILNNNVLQGSLPSTAFDSLAHLTRLDISHNGFTGTIPAAIGKLVALEIFRANINRFSGSLPDEIGTLTNLMDLDLRHNNLDGEVGALAYLTNLANADLSSNAFTGKIEYLAELTKLTQLDLYANKFTGAIGALGRLTSLVYVALDDNRVSGNIQSIAGLTKLTSLFLRHNDVSGNIEALSNLALLESVDVEGNQLNGTINALAGLVNLRLLNIYNNAFSHTIPSSLSSLTKLFDISLGKNQFTGELPTQLGDLVNVRAFNVRDNKLSGTIPQSLSSWTSLARAELGGNRFVAPLPAFPPRAEVNVDQFYLANGANCSAPGTGILCSAGQTNCVDGECQADTNLETSSRGGETPLQPSPDAPTQQGHAGTYGAIAAGCVVIGMVATVALRRYEQSRPEGESPSLNENQVGLRSVASGNPQFRSAV